MPDDIEALAPEQLHDDSELPFWVLEATVVEPTVAVAVFSTLINEPVPFTVPLVETFTVRFAGIWNVFVIDAVNPKLFVNLTTDSGA